MKAADAGPAGQTWPDCSDAAYYLAAIMVGAIVGLFGSALHLGERILAWPSLLQQALILSAEAGEKVPNGEARTSDQSPRIGGWDQR